MPIDPNMLRAIMGQMQQQRGMNPWNAAGATGIPANPMMPGTGNTSATTGLPPSMLPVPMPPPPNPTVPSQGLTQADRYGASGPPHDVSWQDAIRSILEAARYAFLKNNQR